MCSANLQNSTSMMPPSTHRPQVNRVAQIYLRHAHNRNTPKSLRTVVDGASPATQIALATSQLLQDAMKLGLPLGLARRRTTTFKYKETVIKIHAHAKKKKKWWPLMKGVVTFFFVSFVYPFFSSRW